MNEEGKKSIECNVDAEPSAEIFWYKNGEEIWDDIHEIRIYSSKVNSSIQLADLENNRHDVYQCKAENKHGKTEERVRLTGMQID